jgi:multidrug efflux pump subunit AcrA (membrane-fusion protein)
MADDGSFTARAPPGEYKQRPVKTGRVGDEGIEILEGVKEGERVVAQGNLMIDAEAQLRGLNRPDATRHYSQRTGW